ncbi:uncharacterized protein LOC129941172 [Eupeodes corollae]|uniref:uncharacterized protein LOC129941172 n=1 Tax=Eupeodes corollae TaxID=290404 RepID=UPI00248F48AC|nr:uncharacterized protein LOC129941172 [Eupeodes corollae]
MFSYIVIILCCVQFINAVALPKYISTSSHLNEYHENLVETDYYSPSKEVEVTLPSRLLKFSNPTPAPDIKPQILKEQLRQDRVPVTNKETQTTPMEYENPINKGLAEIVEEIRRHHFTEAQKILSGINFNDKIPDIVHQVYNNSMTNIDLLLDFGRNLTKTDVACSVLFALWNEMKVNGHRDVYKMIALVNAIESQLLNVNGSTELKNKAELVTNEGILDITSATVKILKAAMTSAPNNKSNTQARLLADSIFELDSNHKVFDEVIKNVANESFSEVSAIQIAQNLYSHVFISQAISGIQELFKKLEDSHNLDSPAVLNIAEYLKNLKNMPNYVNLSKPKKDAVDAMIQKMPLCARNLIFEPYVCIWNRGKSEYLYVAGSEFNRNEDKRSVFTRTTREAVGPGVWIVEKMGDEFFFQNKAYENEYLFAATGMHSKDSRFVHTWTEGGKVGKKSSWQIVLESDVCYLRNVNYDEYLFASDRQSGDKSRYVFTWIPKTSTREANFQWQIRKCDLSEILKKGL